MLLCDTNIWLALALSGHVHHWASWSSKAAATRSGVISCSRVAAPPQCTRGSCTRRGVGIGAPLCVWDRPDLSSSVTTSFILRPCCAARTLIARISSSGRSSVVFIYPAYCFYAFMAGLRAGPGSVRNPCCVVQTLAALDGCASPSRAACPQQCADCPGSTGPTCGAGCRRKTRSRPRAPVGPGSAVQGQCSAQRGWARCL